MKTSQWCPVLLVVGLLAGFFVGGSIPGQQANAQVAAPVGSGRYQIAAYGSETTNGCYIVDTATGTVWRRTSNATVKVIDKLP